jgi:NifB/MoaA-like Fe-S oxidoreductase
VESYRIPPLTIDEVKQALSLMDASKPVVIGESVTKIMEGEPLAHPKCMQILQEIRNTMPKTPIQITTNGTLLNEEFVTSLKELSPITINLSINSSSCSMRTKLMGDKHARQAIDSIKLLKEFAVPFHGSVVAMPHITGWEDLTNTVQYLDQYGAETVRIFLPGYSKLAPSELQFDMSMWDRLRKWVTELRNKVTVPLTCEPEQLADLTAEVQGVIKESPAANAGIKSGDVILEVNDQAVVTRVQAFNKVLTYENPTIKVTRGNQIYNLTMQKKKRERSGLVMAYDLHPDTIYDIELAVSRNRAQKALALCSQLAYPVLKAALTNIYQGDAEIKLMPVESKFFGGNIMAAGLLVASDFDTAFSNATADNAQVVLMPSIAFDMHGKDLTGASYLDLQHKWGIPVELV